MNRPGLQEPWPPPEAWTVAVPRPSPPAWRVYGLHLLLFGLTAWTVWLTDGPRLVLGLLSILFSHEMGHYLACRYYRVEATLPYFIPAPPVLVGTFGALIRIKSPIPHRRALFDIGIAGPFAGFVVCLPVLALGIREAQVIPAAPAGVGLSFGEPLLFHWMTLLVKGPIPDGMTLLIGPLGLAAWFGLFVTALNLIPVGQLDGGHVTYALLRRRAHVVGRIGFVACLGLIYYGPNWIVWSLLLLVVGRPHPPTLLDHAPVGRGRIVLGVVGLLVLAVCFVPDPIVGSWQMLLHP